MIDSLKVENMKKVKRTNNFFENECGSNDVYNFNRCDPVRQNVRDYCAKLLEHHWKYCADNHFQEDAVVNPQQRWWEMYVSWVLFNPNVGGLKGKIVNGEGPDFCIVLPNEKKIWVEAIAVKPGAGDNEVKRPALGRVGNLPVEKIVLRVTSAFLDKAKKIQKYIDRKIISLDDAVVIAINTGEMRDSDLADQDYPSLAEMSLMGIGEMAFTVPLVCGDKSPKGDEFEVVFPSRKTIRKKEMTEVSTEGFFNHKIISGVFTSTRQMVDMMDSGKDFKILLNPYANCHLNKALFRFGTVISEGQS